MEYSGERENESPVFDDCPTHCDAENGPRVTFCEACPIKAARDEFRAACEEQLKEMPGSRFGFDYLYKCVVDIVNLGTLPPDLETSTTGRLRSIIEGERSRIARVKNWNKQNAAKSSNGS